MKQVIVLTNRSDTPERFDNASVDIEQFGGINYLMVRGAKAGETGHGPLLAAFTIFDFFKVIDTEADEAIKAAKEKIDRLYDVIADAAKQDAEQKKTIEHLQNLVDLFKLEAAARDEKAQAPRLPLNTMPVATHQPMGAPAPLPTHSAPVGECADDYVPLKNGEAYADDSMPPPPLLKEDEPTCHDSSTKSPHPGKKR